VSAGRHQRAAPSQPLAQPHQEDLRAESSVPRPLVESFARLHSLSVRETEVLLLTACGRSIKEISGCLGLSVKTAETYWHRICEKTGCRGQVALLATLLRKALTTEGHRE
jgi:DNA-binding CsgD family transcriptional regulator